MNNVRTLERVHSLIKRALHPSTPVEEARTSAVIALQKVVQEGLLKGPGNDADGYQRGYADGDGSGYTRGVAEAQKAFDRGFEEGRKKGVVEGKRMGFDDGRTFGQKETEGKSIHMSRKAFEDGRELGRKEGRAEARDDIQIDTDSFADGVTRDEEPPKKKATPKRRVIKAKYDGSCRYCHVRWVVGDAIAWCPERGAACVDCSNK